MIKRAFVGLVACAFVLPAAAQTIDANGSINWVQNGASYDYTITLNNTGTSTIGTFWYSWVPGYDFMSLVPTNIAAPTGWSFAVQGGFPGDGYSIEYVANPTARLAAGTSSSAFKFTSTETPAQLNANSPFFPFNPTSTSFVYDGNPEVGLQKEFVVTPVPEPITMLVLTPAILLMRRRRKA